jgi:uncharacterized protein (DUF58 family)
VAAERWLPILILVFILGLALGSPFLVSLTTAMFVILGLASWWKKHALDNVLYRRRFHYTRAFPGESFPVRLEIENSKLLPLSWLRVQDPWPKAIGPVNEDVLAPSHVQDMGFLTHVFSLRWYERVHRRYDLLFRKRGVYLVGPAQLESGDLFGIYEQASPVGPAERLTVFPALAPLSEAGLPAEDPFGERRSRRRLFEDPNRPMGIRAYQPEDSFRRIHWPATARTGQLQVKVFQPTSAQVVMLCLNVSTYHRYWEGVYPALLEHLVSVAAALVHQGLQNGHRVGLISNGSLANSDQPFRIQPGRSPQQLAHLLQALAGVTPLVTAPFDRFLLREVPRVPYGATLAIVTAWTNPELSETLVGIKRHERSILLISVAEEPPPELPGIRNLHIPFVDPASEDTTADGKKHRTLMNADGR